VNISGKTVIITGGASGLGAACAERFVKKGANIVIADLNEKAGNALAKKLGPKAAYHSTNVADESGASSAVNFTLEKFGGIHGLVNCAGIGVLEKVVSSTFAPHSLKSFSKVIEVNLIGTFNMVRLVAAAMAKAESPQPERGVIVNTASIAAYEGQIGQISYAVSKGGVVSMCLPLARELSSFGIRVMTIAPGIFDTPMLESLPDKVKASLATQVPFPPRLGRPEEYAALVEHIFENEMLNGEVLRLDGALRMPAR
jgi:NAD(P)-dependent dehydrogenase (short-subunit alcohol dehydrogenase family)